MSKKVTFELVLDTDGAIVGIKSLEGELIKLDDSVGKTESSSDNLGDSLDNTGNEAKETANKTDDLSNSLGGAGIAGIAFGNILADYLGRGFNMLLGNVSDAIEAGSSYKSSLAELSAITGIAGEDLENLGQTARQQSMETGVGVNDQIEAYKLLASNIDISVIGGVEGLKVLSEETVRLSQASKVDLATSAETVASSINQFGYSADQTSRVVNVLAAGSKFGAAEIADLGLSLKNTGTVAGLAGLDIETTVAAIEVLSQSNLKGSEAGTGLRNTLTILQSGAKELADLGILPTSLKVDGLSKTLEKLSPILNDSAMMNKIFGETAQTTASILVKNNSLLDEMKTRVTGTTVAVEQAIVQTNTYENAKARLSATITEKEIKAYEQLEPLMIQVTEVLIGITKNSEKLIPIIGGAATAVGLLALGWKVYSVAAVEGALATAAASAAINIATGGLFLIVGAIGTLTAVLITNEEAWNGLTLYIEGSIDYVSALVSGLVEHSGMAFELLWEIIKLPFDLFGRYVEGVLNGVSASFSAFVDAVALLFKGDMDGAAEAFTRVFSDSAKEMAKSFAGSFDEIIEKAGSLESEISESLSVEAAKDKMKEGGAALGKAFSEAFNFEVSNNPVKVPEVSATGTTKGGTPETPKDQTSSVLLSVDAEKAKEDIEELQAQLEELMNLEKGMFEYNSKQRELEQDQLDILDEKKIRDLETTALQAKETKKTTDMKVEATKTIIQSQISQTDTSIKNVKDAANAVIAGLRREIQGYIASATAGALKQVFASYPFPISVGVGLAAGAAVNLAFNSLIPEFEKGGKVEENGKIFGNPHSSGGVLIEAEGGEYIINKKSSLYAKELIEQINSSPDKAKELNDSLVVKGFFEQGGFVSRTLDGTSSPPVVDRSYGEILSSLAESLKGLKDIKVHLSLFELQQANIRFNEIQTESGL